MTRMTVESRMHKSFCPSKTPLLRSLCLALARHPRLTLQQLASHAGISKATLYRLASTREALLEILSQHAMAVGVETFERAQLETRPVVQALHDLTRALLENREFYAFALTHHWVSTLDHGGTTPEHERQCEYYEARMQAFFTRGQREGVFRNDMPALWLAKSYNFLLYGLLDTEQRGELPGEALQELLLGVFLRGAQKSDG